MSAKGECNENVPNHNRGNLPTRPTKNKTQTAIKRLHPEPTSLLKTNATLSFLAQHRYIDDVNMTTPTPKHCRVLGLTAKATESEIRRAYRKRALRHHPDRLAKDKKAEGHAAFVEIQEAYEELSDPRRRTAYDRRHLPRTGTSSPTRPANIRPRNPNYSPTAAIPVYLLLEKLWLISRMLSYSRPKIEELQLQCTSEQRELLRQKLGTLEEQSLRAANDVYDLDVQRMDVAMETARKQMKRVCSIVDELQQSESEALGRELISEINRIHTPYYRRESETGR
ncbi:hypothetical protein BJ170DRAFT_595768 [Xylariales sp. AK1849]|nr:hypothetical protein BJ170DRAFT_595768 [Xylariales sp. AK1849]